MGYGQMKQRNIGRGGRRDGRRARCVKRAMGTFLLAASILFICHHAVSPSYAGIPEPGMIVYGKVYDSTGTLVTSGDLLWTFSPVGGGEPFTLTAPLSQIDAQGGPYSYKVIIPFERPVPGAPASDNALPVPSGAMDYARTVEVIGTGISRTDTVTISEEDRGTFMALNIGSVPFTDTDNDGLGDDFEQAIVDADPSDGIRSIDDVHPGDDFDNDGETNGTEWNGGDNPSDPTNAMSTMNPANAYADFHFEIFRAAEQLQAGGFAESVRGAMLICWPREGETFVSGTLEKPAGTAGDAVVDLFVSESGDEASSQEDAYGTLGDLMDDYVSGEYRVTLLATNDGGDPYSLRFRIPVPSYTEGSFPSHSTIEAPLPGAVEVPVAPLLDFDTEGWDYLEIVTADTGDQAYFHVRDGTDSPADKHQVPMEWALEQGVWYALMVDVNDWGNTWLGSMTTLQFRTEGIFCYGDFDDDGDVDGVDLSLFEVGVDDLSQFGEYFGKTTCEIETPLP